MSENKEKVWLFKKVGKFSASRADDLVSKSGKWIQGNIDYLYEIQYQRLTGLPQPQIEARPMRIGKENEPYAIHWLRENHPELNIWHCDADFSEKIFYEPFPDLAFGASPDAFIMADSFSREHGCIYDQEAHDSVRRLIEIKCLVGRTNTVRYLSPTLPYLVKKQMALDEHRGQMAEQLLAYQNVDGIDLLKYLPQLDEDEFDLRSPDDPARGIMFSFSRQELSSDIILHEARMRYADAYLKSGNDLEKINELKINLQ